MIFQLGRTGCNQSQQKMYRGQSCCEYLALQALIVGHQGGELASLVQTRSQQTWDLLDDCLTGQEGTVFLSCTSTTKSVSTVSRTRTQIVDL